MLLRLFRKKLPPKPPPATLDPPWFQDAAFYALVRTYKGGDAWLFDQLREGYQHEEEHWNVFLSKTPGSSFYASVIERMQSRYEGWCGAQQAAAHPKPALGYYRVPAPRPACEEHWYHDTDFWLWAAQAFPQDATLVRSAGGECFSDYPESPLTRAFGRMRRRVQGWIWYQQQRQTS